MEIELVQESALISTIFFSHNGVIVVVLVGIYLLFAFCVTASGSHLDHRFSWVLISLRSRHHSASGHKRPLRAHSSFGLFWPV